MLPERIRHGARRMFQSTPAIADGRCEPGQVNRYGDEVFQSTPAIADGRCGGGRKHQQHPADRFNPRPPLLTGDALAVPRAASSAKVFQSTPAIADGRCLLKAGVGVDTHVSIHARHC